MFRLLPQLGVVLGEYLLCPQASCLPDWPRVPASYGEPTGHTQATAYLTDGMLELWQGTPGAIDFLRR